MTGLSAAQFSPDWLALRSDYDEQSRAERLVAPFAESLTRRDGPVRFTDLATGTASNFLYLAPRLARLSIVDQVWRLVDRDPVVLHRARRRIAERAGASGWAVEPGDGGMVLDAGAWRCTVAFDRLDLARGLESLALADGEAVVVSALLDLVSPAWLQRLVRWAEAARSPMLATLTYDGSIGWEPEDRDDGRIRALFNDHQRRDKGFGPALGPAAPSWLAARLIAGGYAVDQILSPWRLGTDEVTMLNALIETVSESAAEQDPQARRLAAAWASRRRAQASTGILSATVGHIDILGRP